MKPLIYITQLAAYKAQLERHLDVLQVAEGFEPEQKADLIAIYEQLLAKVNEILGTEQTQQ